MSFDRITLAHGGGGLQSERLLRDVIFPALSLTGRGFDDSALLKASSTQTLALTTDSFVVQPLEFPGGDIGKLAVCGTVNDLATAGARPIALTLSLIIEEGLETERLRRICSSIASTAAEVGVAVVSGDTKVVERRTGDGLFINTTGIGIPLRADPPRLSRAQVDDAVLINGTLADHGAAVMAARGDYGIVGPIASDVAPLYGLAAKLIEAIPDIHVLKDPTRGGLSMSLHEIAEASKVGIELEESSIQVVPPVQAFCDLLGFDPLEVANEGKLIVICPEVHAEAALEVMRAHPYGTNAACIGTVKESARPQVTLKTLLGGRRVVAIPTGEILPRIC